MSEQYLSICLFILLIICIVTIWKMRQRIKKLEELASIYFRFSSSEYNEAIQENFKMVQLHIEQEHKIQFLEAEALNLKENIEFWRSQAISKEVHDE